MYASEEPDDRVPSDLAAIMTYARARGAEYVNFECDVSEIDELPAFDWSD